MYFAKVKIAKTESVITKKADTCNNRPAGSYEEVIILGEFEITASTLEKLQEKVAALTNLVEE